MTSELEIESFYDHLDYIGKDHYFWKLVSKDGAILTERFVERFYPRLDILSVVKYTRLNEDLLEELIKHMYADRKQDEFNFNGVAMKKLMNNIFKHQIVSKEFKKKYIRDVIYNFT
jgi:hypothetical protein